MADIQTQTQTNWLQPQWQDYLTRLNSALGTANFQPYAGPTVAPFNPTQQNAVNLYSGVANNGTAAGNAANQAITQQAGGVQNPYASATNPYQGVNPYTSQVIDQTNNRIQDAYSRGTAAQTDAAMARQGAYGGSGYQEQVGVNQRGLADALALNTANQLNQNYYNNANLAENQINRQTNAFDASQNRGLQAAGLGLSSQAQQGMLDQGLLGMGNAQQGYTQSILDAMKNYYTQSQTAPFVPLDILAGGLGKASGAQSSSTLSQPGSSDWLNLIGGAGALWNIFNG